MHVVDEKYDMERRFKRDLYEKGYKNQILHMKKIMNIVQIRREKFMKANNVNIKNNFKKAISLLFIFTLILGCILTNGQKASAKTKALSTCLMQKSNSLYSDYVKEGYAVAYKVKLKSKSIVINGSLKNADTGKRTKTGKHVYKLSNNVQYIFVGGEGPDRKYTNKGFMKEIEKCKNSGIGFGLTLKNNKVTRIEMYS